MSNWRKRVRRLFVTPRKTLRSVDAYALWAKDYPPIAHNILMQIEQNALESLMPDMTDTVVLDLACGTGRYGLLAQSCGATKVIGIDNSFAMLQAAQLEHRFQADMPVLPFSEQQFDVILCGLAIGHYPQILPILREISRILKPDGLVLISDFHPYQYLSGARRTFRADNGVVYDVEHYPHLISQILQDCQSVGLIIDKILEPGLNSEDDKSKAPIVIVYRMRKA